MKRPAENPLLPTGDAREVALYFVVAVLCFLAALSALSARATYGAARDWTAEVEGELTITLFDATAEAAAAAQALIAGDKQVKAARLLGKSEIDALLAPGFGARGLPDSLPVPHLITVTASLADAKLAARLEKTLKAAGYDAAADAHAEWAGDVRRVLAGVRWAAFLLVGLLAAGAIAVTAFATHAALLARRDIVEVLHTSGARDSFIANLFERRFWVLGLRAGAAGALIALFAVAAGSLLLKSGGERTGLLPQLSLDFVDLLFLVLTPIAAGIAARLAARLTVLGALRRPA